MNWLKKLANLFQGSPTKSETGSPPTDPLSQAVSESWSRAFLKELVEENVFSRMLRANENLRGVPERLREPEEPMKPVSMKLVKVDDEPVSGEELRKTIGTLPANSIIPEYTPEAYRLELEKQLRKQYGQNVHIRWMEDVKLPEFPDPSASRPATPPAAASPPESATMSKGVDYVRGPTTYFRSIEDLVALRPEKTTPLTGGGRMVEAADQFGPFEARYDRKDRLRSFTRTERFKEVFGKTIAETRIWIYDPQADEPLEKDSEEYMFEQVATYGAENYFTTLCERHGVNPQPWPPSEHEFVRAIRKLVRGLKIYEGEKFIQ